MATMESILLINPPFIKRDWPRLDDVPSETDKRGLGISLRGRLPRRRDPRLTGSVRIRENFNSGRKPFRRRDKKFHIIKLKLLCFTNIAKPLDRADFNSEIKLIYFVNLQSFNQFENVIQFHNQSTFFTERKLGGITTTEATVQYIKTIRTEGFLWL